ncbi:hydroxymyristoyl-ACP dehydratase [Azohydromonas sp. G-1-1-14]|uniref:Hydroxymyristoyl-ACP dehydratase n=2 Tax=Azohydromonas caseinilytica TaxID=2728836 RepID=A0A848FGF8_9BURK|nr:hydroxymyristoyl-ACP dehydratase [Azohydromonas caseinilytica]NML18538.1 hydroxymyristoyl-ACP dehydratase [Azohydromonas caseinilytica]
MLQRADIAARIPHQGRMCLLDRVRAWDAEAVTCTTGSHRDTDNPLRSAGGLLSPCAIEYAAQAMALHGALVAPPEAGPRPGFLASVRDVRFHTSRLDLLPGDLEIQVRRLAGAGSQVLYQFRVSSDGALVAEGRAAVVLDTPLPPS